MSDAGADRARIAACIAALLDARAGDASICPSEVARALSTDDWRPLMPAVRDVALGLAREGTIEVSAGGQRLDPRSPPVGPIRLRRPTAA